jgi:cytochrome c-type biogenesis protein CcmF
MAGLGSFALLLALVASGWGLVVGCLGAKTGREDATRSAEGALKGSTTALTVAGLALFYALLTKDFRIEYVAQYTSRSLSVFYTLGAFWAGQAGSLLLWAWTLSICASLVVWTNRTRNRDLMPWVDVVLSATIMFFVVLVAFYANPFKVLPVAPADGQGLNPLLQNYGQWVHPIALYLGFVGFTIPFAFAIAALVTGHLGDRWIRTVRKWALWSWILLTAGILFGARWAYVELGWGGYWAWDPVENASLLPWLVATAYLHSVVVQEKRGLMKVWNVALAAATFSLSIFGTFLTRSGVISSVHAFAESTMGPLLIGFTLLSVALTAALIVWRLPELRPTGRFGAIVSRESSFLLTNVLFVAMTAVVFWGTVYPLVAQAFRGIKVQVGPSFFQALMVPLVVLTLALVGICPLLAWRHQSAKHLRRNFTVPLTAGSIALGLLLILTRGDHLGLVIVLSLGAFVMATVVEEIARGLRARRELHGEGWFTAVRNLFAFTPRRYGGPLVHAGMVVLIAGIALNVSFKQETRGTLAIGEAAKVGGFTVTLQDLATEQEGAHSAIVGRFGVSDASGNDLGTIRAEQAFYENQQQVTEVGMRSTPASDLYVVMNGVDTTQGVATVDLFVEPGVFWLWLGMVLVLIGGVIAAWPRRANMQVREASELELAELSASRSEPGTGVES